MHIYIDIWWWADKINLLVNFIQTFSICTQLLQYIYLAWPGLSQVKTTPICFVIGTFFLSLVLFQDVPISLPAGVVFVCLRPFLFLLRQVGCQEQETLNILACFENGLFDLANILHTWLDLLLSASVCTSGFTQVVLLHQVLLQTEKKNSKTF